MKKLGKLQNFTFFEKVKEIHFIGIGGVSMSSLALLSKKLGLKVTGSDMSIGTEVEKLKRAGIEVYIGHSASNIGQNVDMIVFTGAIKDTNEELIEAKNRGIECVERSEYLGNIASIYDYVIAVAGSHGKTSTTAMISHIFKVAGLKPTMHLGGDALGMGNLMLGDTKYFITEACEYRNSMRYLNPNVSVVTNVDNDHLDYYKTEKNLIKAFQQFVNKTKDFVFVSSERKFRQKFRDNTIYSVGLNNNQDIYAKNVRKTKKGFVFDVVYLDQNLGEFKLNILGKHNIKNAMYAISVAYMYNVKLSKIKKAIRSYKGVKRRYEKRGKYRNIPIISDYAHHPTEIRNSIAGLRGRYKNMLVIFQPHTYSRTKLCMKDFKGAFRGCRGLVIYKTYPAREKYDPNGDENALFNAVVNRVKRLAKDQTEAKQMVDELVDKYRIDAIVLMGAGDVGR